MQTLAQYEDAIKADFFANYPDGITKTEYDEVYPRGSRQEDWERMILDAARSYEVIPARILDYLYTNSRRAYDSLYHEYGRRCWPEGYLNPGARAV